jgi:murein DD-endopeptidase MepM/ murein hydrolase activator NlpD/ubiquitin
LLPQCSTRFGFFGVLILGLSLLLCGASPALAIDNPPASTTTKTTPPAVSTTNANTAIAETMNWFAGTCFSCGIISRLFAASMQYGKVLMPMFGSGIGTFLSVVFVIWVFIQVAKMLLPFAPANRTNAIASTMFTKGALVLIVSLILFSPKSYDIYWRYIYKPVVSVSINMSSALLNEGTKGQTGPYVVDTFTLKDGNKCSKTVITGLTSEERALQYRLECMVHTFQNAFSYGLATGWYMITKTGGNANNILIGIIVFVVSITPPITFAVMILDAVIRWVIISCLSPALMGCYCFPATRNYANTGFKGLLEAGLTLSIVSVVAVLSAGVIQEATKTVQASMDKAGSAVAGAASTAATAVKGAIKGDTTTTTPATTSTKTLSSYLRHDPLSGSTNVEPTNNGNTPSFNGSLRYPIKLGGNCIKSSDFESKERPNHKGVDFSCPIGTPVTPAAPGMVIKADSDGTGGYGNLVVIHHPDGGYNTVYGHLDKIFVTKGQQVDVNMIIARVGNTGRSTGPHLHFELRLGGDETNPYSGDAENPMLYLNGQPVPNAAIASGQGSNESGQPLHTFAMAATWLIIFAPMMSKFALNMIAAITAKLLAGGFGGAMGSAGSAFTPGMGAAMGVAGFGVGAIGQGAFNVLANNEMVAKGLDAIKDGAGAVGGAVGGVVGDIGQRVTEAAMSGINTLRQNNAFVDGALNALAAGGNFVGDIGCRVAATAMSGINAVGDFAKGMQEHLQQKFQDTQQFLQMLEANRIAFMNNMHQAPGEFLKAVNDFLRQNEGISKTFDSIQSLQKGFGDLVDHARAELQRLQNQLATVGNNVYQALPSPVQTGLRVGGDIAQNIGNRAGEFVNNFKDQAINDIKAMPMAAVKNTLVLLGSTLPIVPLTIVHAAVGDATGLAFTRFVDAANVGIGTANAIFSPGNSAGNHERQIILHQAETTNEDQRQQALNALEQQKQHHTQRIDDLKETIKQELADIKSREQALRSNTSLSPAEFKEQSNQLSEERTRLLNGGQASVSHFVAERDAFNKNYDNMIRDINAIHDNNAANIKDLRDAYLGKKDEKYIDTKDTYAAQTNTITTTIQRNEQRLQEIDKQIRELPTSDLSKKEVATKIAGLIGEKDLLNRDNKRLEEQKLELSIQKATEVKTLLANQKKETLAGNSVRQTAENIIEQQNKAQERATKRATAQQAKQEGWNDGVRAQLEKIQADQAAKRASRQPAGFP